VWGDQAYTGRSSVRSRAPPRGKDFTNRKHRGGASVNEVAYGRNRVKSQVRAKVEAVIGVIKRIFGFAKVRYRGLAKNLRRLRSPRRWPTCILSGAACSLRRSGVSIQRQTERTAAKSGRSEARNRALRVRGSKSTRLGVFVGSFSDVP
jgi:hypothetical protein